VPRWALVTGLVLFTLLIGALVVNILAINHLLVNEFIPGNQLCRVAVQAHLINAHITVPKACARVGLKP